jgi:hypothetical protein
MKPATRRETCRVRYLTAHDVSQRHIRIETWYSGEKRLGVRVLRIAVQSLRRSELNQLTRVHHAYVMAHMLNHRKVM